MRTRDTLLVAKTKADLDKAFQAYGGGFVDVTDLMDRKHYSAQLSRSGVGMEMAKKMPKDTHQRVGIVVPIEEGESDDAWERRCWTHGLISIMTSSYHHCYAINGARAF